MQLTAPVRHLEVTGGLLGGSQAQLEHKVCDGTSGKARFTGTFLQRAVFERNSEDSGTWRFPANPSPFT